MGAGVDVALGAGVDVAVGASVDVALGAAEDVAVDVGVGVGVGFSESDLSVDSGGIQASRHNTPVRRNRNHKGENCPLFMKYHSADPRILRTEHQARASPSLVRSSR